MSVIIRLQNLPWSANALDIRQYFQGLSIPDGGVHIVGGELGDAFIAFSTDEDARQAFNLNGGKLKEVQVKLLLSSRTEMQKVIESARNQSMAAFVTTPTPTPSIPVMPAIVPSVVPEIKKDESRDRRRSRSRSKDRKDRNYDRKRDKRRERSRSKSRERSNRDRRRRDRSRSRSRDRDRKNRRVGDKTVSSSTVIPKEQRVNVWENPPQLNSNLLGSTQPDPANLIANFVANNILPNILNRNNGDQSLIDRRNLPWDNNSTMPYQPSNTYNLNGNPYGYPDDDNSNYNQNQLDCRDSVDDRRENIDGRDRRENVGTRDRRENIDNRDRRENDGRDRRENMDGRDRRDNMDGRERRENMDGRDRRENMDGRDRRDNRDGRDRREMRDHYDSRDDDIPNCCVKLVPFYGPFSEIRRFFNGSFIHNSGIKFINDENGKRTGIVYIKFAYPSGKDEALGRSGDTIRNQKIMVEHLDDLAFENAIDRFIPEVGNDKNKNKPRLTSFTCITIENVAMYIKEPDIRNMFHNFPSILVAFESINRKKNVYVKFSNPKDAIEAFENTDHLLGGQNVHIVPCDEETFEKVVNHEAESVNTPCPSIIISGLPMKCSDRDIIDFFSDIGVMPSKIEMIVDDSGLSGEAICDFFNIDDAIMGFQKNGMLFGSDKIEMKYNQKVNTEIHHDRPMLNPRIPLYNGPNMGMHRPFFPRHPFMGGPRMPPRGLPPMMGMMPRGMPPRHFMPPHMQRMEDHDESLAAPGCILLMENVPYTAGLQEILDFFDGFDIPADNVLRKYNFKGMPSGETKVIFNSPDEVYHVIQEKSGARIRNRPIFLSQI